MIDYTTVALIANVKRRAMVPTSQSTFDDNTFCGMLTDELQSLLVPMLMELNSQFYVYAKDWDINGTQKIFSIPSRSINQKILGVQVYDPSNENFYRPVQIANGQWGFNQATQNVQTFSILHEQVVFNVAPVQTDKKIRMFYYRRPNNLILPTAAGQITAIDLNTNIVTVNLNPGFSTDSVLDFIQGSGAFRALQDDVTPTNVSGQDLTFATLPDGLSIGDWVCPAGEAPVAQIPYESQHVLCQAVAIKLLESLGDPNMIEFSQKKMDELQTHMQSVMKLRVDDQPIKIVNRGGIVDSVRYRNGFYWW
jgi:hypothetical protein